MLHALHGVLQQAKNAIAQALEKRPLIIYLGALAILLVMAFASTPTYYLGAMLFSVFLISKGSDWITDSMVPVAKWLGTSNLAVGLLLVSMLLSLPEIIIALFAIFGGHTGIAFGVTIGSIIINIGIIIGLSALVRPLRVSRAMLLRDGIFMVIAATITVALSTDLQITQQEGFVFLLIFIPYVINVYEQEKSISPEARRETEERIIMSLKFAGRLDPYEFELHAGAFSFAAGVAMLLLGAKFFSDALIGTAAILDVPDLLIGLTLGALGPSIPNIAAGIQATRRGYEELAVSETIGSNIFTLLVTLGLVAMVKGLEIDADAFFLNAVAMLVMSYLFLALMLKGWITRRDGVFLLLVYAGILAIQILFTPNV
ncbi:MAG: hypothetical protein WC792_01955 [Candidatus Micrarchaeia archaeon]|jgi:cation:H+ antiporter